MGTIANIAVKTKTSSTGVASSPINEAKPTEEGRRLEAKRYSFHPSKNAITVT